MNQYVIAYDIADKKRLVRMHRYLQHHATRYPAKHLSVLRFGIAKDGLHILN